MPRYLSALCGAVLCALPLMTKAQSMPYSPPPADQWEYLSDQVMGGVSEGRASIASDDAESYLRLTGTVSTENRGGFIQTRVALPDGLPAATTGLVLQVRSNAETYFVHLRTTGTMLPWQYYQAGFEVGPDWQEVRLPLSAFEPSGRLLRGTPKAGSITSVGFVAYGKDHEADLSARWVGVY